MLAHRPLVGGVGTVNSLPQHVNTQKIVATVVNYLRANPKKRAFDAAPEVQLAPNSRPTSGWSRRGSNVTPQVRAKRADAGGALQAVNHRDVSFVSSFGSNSLWGIGSPATSPGPRRQTTHHVWSIHVLTMKTSSGASGVVASAGTNASATRK